MDVHAQPLKIYFIPFLAHGHLVSLFELSRLFSARGQHVTFLTTHATSQLLHKSIEKAKACNQHIHVHNFKFPSKEVGLSEGIENLISINIRDMETVSKVYMGMKLLQQPMELFMQQNPPDCIVSDMFHSWTTHFANSLGIPRLHFDPSSIFQSCLLESFRGPDSPHRKLTSESEPFLIPGLPHPITITLSQLPDYVKTTSELGLIVEETREAELNCYGRLVNGFAEVEQEYALHYQKIMRLNVWHLGPTSLLNRTAEEKTERSMKTMVSEHECLSWLNSKPPNSVIYICFGSSWIFPDNQLYEIASGIESSGHPFIWVIHGKNDSEKESEEEKQKWLPKGFEERMKRENKGMIVRGWAPQTLILDHRAIGVYVCHCGWNAVMEGICAGVPMITWPLSAEQFYNEKLITQVHRIGVEVGSDEWTLTPGQPRKKLVTRDRIEAAVRKLTEEGIEMRRRVRELQEKAKAAMEEGGSSQRNLTALIEDLKRLRSIKSNGQDSMIMVKT